MPYIGNQPFGKTVRTITSETLTSVANTFYPTGGYTVGYVDVYLNGVRLTETADFTATDGSTVTLLFNPLISDTVDIVSYGTVEMANAVRREGDTLIGTLNTRSLVPTANVTYDIGTSNLRYRDLYLSGNTIQLGNVSLSTNGEVFIVANTTGGVLPSKLGNTTITGTLTANDTTIVGSANVTGVLAAGNTTITGNTVITGNSGNGFETFRINTLANSASFNWAASIVANNLVSNANIISFIGQKLNTKNSGYIGFRYNSDQSNNNILTFGLYGVDNILNINGQGRVGVGNTTPQEKLHVTGAILSGTKVQNGAYEPAVSIASPGQGFGNASVMLQQTTSEADSIIFADFEPYVEWNFSHRNSTNEFIMHSGNANNSLESSTFYNRAGDSRTGYAKFKFGLVNGDATIGGRIFVKNQPGFLAYPASSLDTTSGTIPYNAERFDTAGNYNTSTYTFTAPVDGKYAFGFSFWAPPSSVAMCKMQINGANWNGMPFPRVKAYDASHYVYGSASVIVNLSANDYVNVVWVEGTVHINTIYNYFYGYLLG